MAEAEKLRVLFLARRFPPSVGGAQMHAGKLCEQLGQLCDVRRIVLGRESILHLAWWMPRALIGALWSLLTRRTDVVYFGDGVTAALATVLRPVTSAAFVTSVYGLELTYGNAAFRTLMRWGIARCGAVCVISEETARLAEASGIAQEKVKLIYLGVETPEMDGKRCAEVRRAFENEHGVTFGTEKVVLNIGRMVKRKGIADFIEKGAPLLRDDVRMFVGGTGPELERVRELIRERRLEGRITALGFVDDETAGMLRRSCDLWLMTNVQTPGDVEGFGIAPLEAMRDGLPVVSFAVDALVESMREGAFLVEAGDYAAFVERVHSYLDASPEEQDSMKKVAVDYVVREYGWDKTGREYVAVFDATIAAKDGNA